MESAEQSELSEHSHPEGQVKASSDNERVISSSAHSSDLGQATKHQIKSVTEVSELEDITHFVKIQELDVNDVIQNYHDSQEIEPSTDESKTQNTIQSSDLTVMNMTDTRTRTRAENESLHDAPVAFSDILFSQKSGALDNSITEEQLDRSILPPVPPRCPILPPVKIIISPPSTHDLKVHTGHYRGVLTQDSNGVPGDGKIVPVMVDTTAPGDAETSMSMEIDTSGGGKAYVELSDMSIGDASDVSTCHEKLLFSTSEETDVDLEIDSVPPITGHVPGLCVSKSKHIDHSQTEQKLHLKQRKIHSPDDLSISDRLEPHESMEEIDLNDESFSCDLEKLDSVVREPSLPESEQSRSGDVRDTSNTTMNFLQSNVVKGVIAQGVRMKEVVNEKLSITKLCQETPEPTKTTAVIDDLLPCAPPSDNLKTITPDTKLPNVVPYLILAESNVARDQGLNEDFLVSTYSTDKQSVNFMASLKDPTIVNFVHFSKRKDRTFESPTPGLLHELEETDPNKHLYSRPESSASFVHSTITQSPGPMRGYTTVYPTAYGVPVPPSLPPPPPVPVEDYFASRYFSARFFPSTSPSHDPASEDADRKKCNNLDSPRSRLTTGVNYAASFANLKSNQMKDRKLSSSVSETSRTNPVVDSLLEEGRVQRSSMDSGSDQFQPHGLRMLTTNDLLKGAMCCCFWPLGLAARLFTLTIPDRGGPVDICVKAMSRQLSLFNLLLGIATYLVFFMLGLSLIVVTNDSN